jgi:3',5'-cyclic AMP phosphodiesterase CpdA
MRPKRSAGRATLLLCAAVLGLLLAAAGLEASRALASESPYHHVVVLADPHLPGKYLPAKEQVIQTINAWADVDAVAVLGDICEDTGTVERYALAKQFFGKLTKPAFFIAGNHDYIYEDTKNSRGQLVRGSAGSRGAKLQRFKDTFGLDEVYSSRRIGEYLLIFLSTDDPISNHLAQLSNRQLEWLRAELAKHGEHPTAIFFHAPLKGTLLDYNDRANTDDFVAQPQNELREILLRNPQVFLWVSGHMHTPATNESFRAPINVFENQVTTIHNADMNRERIWTSSLFFYPDRVVVKTYDHKAGAWMESLERAVALPRK